jgi:hypothetical protein
MYSDNDNTMRDGKNLSKLWKTILLYLRRGKKKSFAMQSKNRKSVFGVRNMNSSEHIVRKRVALAILAVFFFY